MDVIAGLVVAVASSALVLGAVLSNRRAERSLAKAIKSSDEARAALKEWGSDVAQATAKLEALNPDSAAQPVSTHAEAPSTQSSGRLAAEWERLVANSVEEWSLTRPSWLAVLVGTSPRPRYRAAHGVTQVTVPLAWISETGTEPTVGMADQVMRYVLTANYDDLLERSLKREHLRDAGIFIATGSENPLVQSWRNSVRRLGDAFEDDWSADIDNALRPI